jgi:hypothetical protein
MNFKNLSCVDFPFIWVNNLTFFFCKMSRPALRRTQTLVNYYNGLKRSGREADHWPTRSAEVNCSYVSSCHTRDTFTSLPFTHRLRVDHFLASFLWDGRVNPPTKSLLILLPSSCFSQNVFRGVSSDIPTYVHAASEGRASTKYFINYCFRNFSNCGLQMNPLKPCGSVMHRQV